MNEKDIEKLLQAMPLKKPSRMPEMLVARKRRNRRLGLVLRDAISLRVPIWQAAAAVAVALVIYAGVGRLLFVSGEKFPHAGAVVEVLAPREPGVAPRTEIVTAEGQDFWVLPDRYSRMITAAKKERGQIMNFWRDGQ